MGKKKSPKVAKLPDLNALSDKMYGMNQESLAQQTQTNRPNQTNPFSSLTWDKDPTTGEWTQSQSFSPEQQKLYDQQLGTQGILGQKANSLAGNIDMTYGGAPEMPTVGGYNQQVIDTINALQQPGLDRARSAKEAQLAAMGVGTGTGRAWNAEQGNLGDTENRARMNAILAGINQGNTQFTQGLQARQQGVQEENNRMDAIKGMMGLSAPTTGQFASFNPQQGFVQAPDYVSNAIAKTQNQQAINNAKAASSGGLLGGMGGTIGAIAGNMIMPGWGGAIGGALGGGLDSGSLSGALQGGLGGYMQYGGGGSIFGGSPIQSATPVPLNSYTTASGRFGI
jgi:hypothetical protein